MVKAVGLAATGLVVVFSACSSEFEKCRETRTCPIEVLAGASGEGQGGDTAIGGESNRGGSSPDAGANSGGDGTAPQQACLTAEDCDPDACNPRSCDDGICVDHAACESPDSDHCSVSCEVRSGKPVCQVLGADADDDGHGDSLCQDDPTADDCDDQNDKTYGGAEEICDGVDNDCDGRGELEQGVFSLGGQEEPAGAGQLSVAWSAESKTYEVAQLNGKLLDYVRWDANGKVLPDSKVTLRTTKTNLGAPLLASDGKSTAVVYTEEEPDANQAMKLQMYLARLDASGQLLGDRVALTESRNDADLPYDIAPRASGGWAIGYEHYPFGGTRRTVLRRLSSLGEPSGGELKLSASDEALSYPALSALGDRIVASWITGFDKDALNFWSPRKGDLSSDGEFPIVDKVGEGRGVAQPTDSGYAMAWYGKTTTPGEVALKFEQRDADGIVTCGPISLYTFSAATPPSLPTVVPYRGGYFVIGGVDVQTGASLYVAKLRVFVLNEGCDDTYVNFLLSPTEVAGGIRPRVAIGEDTLVFTWATADLSYERLVTGRNLCLP